MRLLVHFKRAGEDPRAEGRRSRWQAEANPSCLVRLLPHSDLFTWKTAGATLWAPREGMRWAFHSFLWVFSCFLQENDLLLTGHCQIPLPTEPGCALPGKTAQPRVPRDRGTELQGIHRHEADTKLQPPNLFWEKLEPRKGQPPAGFHGSQSSQKGPGRSPALFRGRNRGQERREACPGHMARRWQSPCRVVLPACPCLPVWDT